MWVSRYRGIEHADFSLFGRMLMKSNVKFEEGLLMRKIFKKLRANFFF